MIYTFPLFLIAEYVTETFQNEIILSGLNEMAQNANFGTSFSRNLFIIIVTLFTVFVIKSYSNTNFK